MFRFLFILLILPAWLFSGYIDYTGYGEALNLSSVNSASRGGAGLTTDPLLNPANPAVIGYSVYMMVGADYQTESETQSVFDNYNNRIGNLTISQSRSVHLAPYSAYGAIQYENFGGMFFAGLVRDYFYHHEIIERDDFYQTTGIIKQTGSGQGIATGISMNYQFPVVSFGLAVNYLNLNQQKKYQHLFYQPIAEDTVIESSFDQTGLFYRVGSVVHVLPQVDAAFILQSKNQDVQQPLEVGIGINYLARAIIPARVYFDFYYKFYNQLDENLQDTKIYCFGIENQFSRNVKILLGGGYEENCFNSEADAAYFSGGFEFHQQNLVIQTSMDYRQKQYPKQMSDITIHDNSMNFIVGLGYNL